MKLTGRGGTKVFIGPHMLLPADKARHVGEAVAMVVAETRADAQTAAENVNVDYEELPWVADTAAAALPDAPRVWEELPDNILVDTDFGVAAAVEAAFAKARHCIDMKVHIGRVTGVPLEPRAALGVYDAETDPYTLYADSGGAVRQSTSSPRSSARVPTSSISWRSISAAISARAIASMSNSAWCCGRRASWAGR